MSKRITIFLSDAAEKYFNLVMYGLEVPDGKGYTKPCNQSQAISHCLEELALFEEFTEDQLTNWLLTNYPDKYKAYRDALPAEMKKPELPNLIDQFIAENQVLDKMEKWVSEDNPEKPAQSDKP